MTQLPTNHPSSAQAQRRTRRAVWLALPALFAVGAVTWVGLDATRAPAQKTAHSPAQPHGPAEQLITAINASSLQKSPPALLADIESPTAVEPRESVIELTQIDHDLDEPPAPPIEAPQPVAAIIDAHVTPSVAEPDNCVSELRRFAQDQIIRFSSGRADLEDSDLPVLRRIGRMAEDCPNIVIQVKGHTDSTGSDVINLALSWERADNTIATLAALGIETRNFEPIGFGARAPLAQGDTSDDEFNRRVEFQVFTTEETTQ